MARVGVYSSKCSSLWSLVSLDRDKVDVFSCDMIKRNESDVGDVVFEILAKTVFKFLCFMLFLALTNPS